MSHSYLFIASTSSLASGTSFPCLGTAGEAAVTAAAAPAAMLPAAAADADFRSMDAKRALEGRKEAETHKM